jgi:hypothetical protein
MKHVIILTGEEHSFHTEKPHLLDLELFRLIDSGHKAFEGKI